MGGRLPCEALAEKPLGTRDGLGRGGELRCTRAIGNCLLALGSEVQTRLGTGLGLFLGLDRSLDRGQRTTVFRCVLSAHARRGPETHLLATG